MRGRKLDQKKVDRAHTLKKHLSVSDVARVMKIDRRQAQRYLKHPPATLIHTSKKRGLQGATQ